MAVAARLFHERGYDGVGVDDIGAAAGISGAAIYRHFRGKQHLLATVVERMLSRINDSLAQVDEPALEDLVRLTTEFVVDDRELMSAYLRWSRSLPDEVSHRVRAQQAVLGARWRRALRAQRPDVSPAEARYRAAAVTGMAIAAAQRPARISPEHRELLERLMLASVTAQARTITFEGGRPEEHQASGRRGELLQIGVRLFRERGFPGVSVEAIAGAAGIDQSSFYRHFAGKDELLLSGLDLAQRRLDTAADEVMADDLLTEERLHQLVASYVDTALRNRDLLAVWLTESVHLPEDKRRRTARAQRAYRDLWVKTLQDTYPVLEPGRATEGVSAAFALLSTGASLRGGLSTRNLRELLQGMALACLDATSPST